MKNTITRLTKSEAMVCFGKLVKLVELDPDPNTQDKLQAEFNCENCDTKTYCDRLANTLK